MPNLVGTGLNQVPTNSMLGGLAYQDPEHASIKNLDLKNLSQINSEIADTATDVFVYDTSKDSDGGAWRKRTQNTSWYNETLGTSVRGTRKEFPAVAVIVCGTDGSNGYVHIYDGDDPDLPMWMVFSGGNTAFLYTTPTSVAAINGMIFVGTPTYGLVRYDFAGDTIGRWRAGSYQGYKSPTSIKDRSESWIATISAPPFDTAALVNDNINDVAITVLPNAPIDSATGLPVPTIAIATNGGVSVIKDDGSVVDLTYQEATNNQVPFLDIDSNGRIYWSTRKSGSIGIYFHDADLPVSDSSSEPPVNLSVHQAGAANAIRNLTAGTLTDVVRTKDKTVLGIDGSDGKAHLNLYNTTGNVNSGGSLDNFQIVDISKDYNTGYMHGDIKGAFLSDTDTTDAVATYYDDFANNDKGWGFVDTSITGGNMVITQQGSARSTDYDALNGIATGTKLVFTFTVSGSGTGSVIFDDDGVGAGVGGNTNYGSFNSTGLKTFTATKTASNRIRIMRTSGSNDYEINFLNISTEFDDRSVNNNPLTVFGTLTRTPVATGAELVAYSGFSASNYLQQPYNSDMDFGTGDLSVIFWYKMTSSSTLQCLLHRGDGGTGTWGSGNLIQIEMDGNDLEFQLAGPVFSPNTQVQVPVAQSVTGEWQHFVGVRKGGKMHVYIDGVKYGNTASTQNVTNTSATTWIGQRPNSSRPASNTSMTLFRMSATAPSEEQVKKIYEDEKCLFHENAKATLYSSSDAVTALAFDDTTELLHVGTSAGRSDFRGLRRINNTTTAVTTAISAHDEFIIEQ